MIATLSQWSRQCDLVLAEIMGRIRDVKVAAQNRKLAEEEYERGVDIAKNRGMAKKGNSETLGGKGGKGKEVEENLMQDVTEGIGLTTVAGGESPTGKKRKLVPPLSEDILLIICREHHNCILSRKIY